MLFYFKISHIWKVYLYIEFLFFIQFWCRFFFEQNWLRLKLPEFSHIWKAYLTLEISKIQLFQHIIVSNILFCSAIYCAKQNTVSTLTCNIHLFNFPCLYITERYELWQNQSYLRWHRLNDMNSDRTNHIQDGIDWTIWTLTEPIIFKMT